MKPQPQKHLSLVEDAWLPWISQIQRHVVPAYAAWLSLCNEARERIEAGQLPKELEDSIEAVEEFLENNLRLAVSVGARGRSDLVAALRGDSEEWRHPDRDFLPFDKDRPREVQEGKRLAKQGLRDARGPFGR